MPSSLLVEMDRSTNGQIDADQRALQIALELSMLGLTNDDDQTSNAFDDIRNKKSMNMTECVPVPSSEHVAEIVGRQGCKIKALRAKTNTYIKTPVRGEDPVFVVTGRKEDVALAKREIISAAEHFSQIRAQRKNNSLNSLAPGPPSPTTPGQTTIHVRVPYRVVGLVVGPKGATIKRIQQQTNTYIVTPSRDKEPVFEVTGMPDNVESARKEIDNHITMRTGGRMDTTDDVFIGDGLQGSFNDFAPSSIYSSVSSSFSAFRESSSSLGLPQRTSSDSFYGYPSSKSSSINDGGFNPINSPFSANGFFFNDLPSPTDREVGSEGSSTGSGFDPAPAPPSPSIWGNVPSTRSMNEQAPFTRSSSLNSQALNSAIGRPASPHSAARRMKSDPLTGNFSPLSAFTPFTTQVTASSVSSIPATSSNGTISTSETNVVSTIGFSATEEANNNNTSPLNKDMKKKDCVICCESEVVAALVPCGHNLFCMECANRIKDENNSCPVCQKNIDQVLRIFS
ncbi:RNA-binding protein MEX3B-like [Orbicella faveolata]|uniref:RNA-binding protein MEX3B-like n=1 Tax=Orbicella faveolata TaxID=48498 RepID=UPI0009E50537|nr:RNA-binding protein MEX3B-like [Orbicella faveolata]